MLRVVPNSWFYCKNNAEWWSIQIHGWMLRSWLSPKEVVHTGEMLIDTGDLFSTV